MVGHAAALMGRELIVGCKIRDLVLFYSLAVGSAAIFYSESTSVFLLCMGKEERFSNDLNNFEDQTVGGLGIKLDFFNPFE